MHSFFFIWSKKNIFLQRALSASPTLRVFPLASQMSYTDDLTQPQPSFSLTMPFPYDCDESEEEGIESTLAMPRSQLDATQDLSPTLPTAMVSPPVITRIQSDDIEDSQIESPQVPSTFSLPPTAAKSPVCEPPVIRRPLSLRDSGDQPVSCRPRVNRRTDLAFARACFAGELKSISTDSERRTRLRNVGKKVKLKKVKASQGLDPSFVDLVRGVCGIFNTQTGKHANLEKVCASFFQ